MYFDELPTDYTDEEILGMVGRSPFVSDMERVKLAEYAAKPCTKPNLPFSVLSRLYNVIKVKEADTASHLQDKFVTKVACGDAVITASGVVVHTPDGQTSFTPSRGYMIKEEDSKLVVQCHIADALAYMYTPASDDKLKSMSIANNFANTNPKAATPLITQSCPRPEQWVSSDAMANSRAQYLALKTSTAIAGATKFMQSIYKSAPYMDKAFRDIKLRGGKDMTIPNLFLPPLLNLTDTDLAWRLLSVHRQVRAEDNSWVSPMTSGYYLGGFNRALDRVLWQLSDVLSVLRSTTCTCVYFQVAINSIVATSLAANGYVVLVSTSNVYTEALPLTDAVVPPGVYPYSIRNPIPDKTLVVTGFSVDRPVVTTTEVKYPANQDMALKAFMKCSGTIMTWAFLTPVITSSTCVLLPSMHAHAGHVVLYQSDKEALKTTSVTMLMNRFAVANIIKTWFPLSRVRFLELDVKRYKIQFLSLTQRMLLRQRPTSVKKYEVFGELDNSFDIDMTAEDEIVKNFSSVFEDMPQVTVVRAPPIIFQTSMMPQVVLEQFKTTTTTTTTASASTDNDASAQIPPSETDEGGDFGEFVDDIDFS